jgi:hypothetical protein
MVLQKGGVALDRARQSALLGHPLLSGAEHKRLYGIVRILGPQPTLGVFASDLVR